MNNGPTHPEMIATRLRHVDWMNQRRDRRRIIDIATDAGVTPGTVCEAIKKLMMELPKEDALVVRELENQALDESQTIALAVARDAGDPDLRLRAIDRILRVSKRRSEINGTDEPPKAAVDKDGNAVPSFVALPGQLPESVSDWMRDFGAAAQHGEADE